MQALKKLNKNTEFYYQFVYLVHHESCFEMYTMSSLIDVFVYKCYIFFFENSVYKPKMCVYYCVHEETP